MKICNRKLAARIRNYEESLFRLRVCSGRITPKDAERERILQQRIHDDIETLLDNGYYKDGSKIKQKPA